MYEAILVLLDGSSAAEIVLPYVEGIGANLGSEITLASVSDAHTTDVDHLYRSYLERVREEVQRKVRDYGGGQAKVFWKILLGKPADEILSYADETNSSLIVMASRGSSGQGPWLLGNIAAKVLMATTKPVLLVRAPASDAALQEKRLVKRVLLPLDGSEVGETAIPCTAELARALGAELVLLQAVQPVVIVESSEVDVSYPQPVADESRMASVMAYLDGVGKTLKEKGTKTSRVVLIGTPADQILDYTVANAIDLIAMSTHGQNRHRAVGFW
ncbi:universal stress protein [Chloroflexota bacterium]